MSAYSSPAELDGALTEIGSTLGGKWISVHTGSPGTTGANEVTGGSYVRVATTWGTPAHSNPDSMAGAQVTLNIPSSTTITYWGLWTAVSGGTYIDGGPLPSSEIYSVAGTYLLTPTLTAS